MWKLFDMSCLVSVVLKVFMNVICFMMCFSSFAQCGVTLPMFFMAITLWKKEVKQEGRGRAQPLKE